MEPLYYGHFGTLILVLITEVSSIQRSFSTPQYYTGTQNGVLIIEVSAIQRFVIERFHCIIHVCFRLSCVDTQTVNFTLRSTLHNIDFGLVVDGVTFYDCSVRDK